MFFFLPSTISPVSVHVEGGGYFRLLLHGHAVYAKKLSITSIDGNLGSNGATFLPPISVPDGATSVQIAKDGKVTFSTADGDLPAGRILLATFDSDNAFSTSGPFLTATDAPALGIAESPNFGSIADGLTARKLQFAQLPVAEDQHFDPKPDPAPDPAPNTVPVSSHTEPQGNLAHRQTTVDHSPETKQPTTAYTGGKYIIAVHPISSVPAGSFTLGSIADIVAPADQLSVLNAIVIGSTPPVGISRGLSTELISLRLRGAHEDLQKFDIQVPTGAKVSQDSQTVNAQDLITTAVTAAQKATSLQIPLAVVSPVSDVVIAPGVVTFQASPPVNMNHQWSVTVTILLDGQPVTSRVITVGPSADAPKAISGSPVTVVLKIGTATVTVPGRLQSSGFVGEKVEVTVTGIGTTDTVHVGTLVAPDRVEVSL